MFGFCGSSRGIGGDAMSILKVSVLTTSAFVLWLAPPFVLNKKIPLHNFTTGLALLGSFACCFEARRVAVKLSQVEEFEAMKSAAINADVADELATEIYVSEQQRRIEAEALLNQGSERSRTVEMLERALSLDASGESEAEPERSQGSLTSGTKESEAEPERSPSDLTPEEQVLAERIINLKVRGYGKAKIILEIWGASKGGSQKYKDAEVEYKRLVGES